MINQYIHKYGKRLYGLCITLCADKFSAEDLYQETWLKVCRKFEQYDSSKPFESWLTGICVNTYRDELRKQRISKIFDGFTTTEEKDKAIEEVAESVPDDYSELHEAIDRLSDKLRITVILHYFNGFSAADTAISLGVPVGTVKSRLNQARKKLRKELENESNLQF